MAKVFIYPYKQGSRSAMALSQELDAKLIKLEGSKFKGAADKVVVNWGAGQLSPEAARAGRVLNHPDKIARVANKLSFFRLIEGQAADQRASIPEFTTNKETVRGWLAGGTKLVFARTVLNGHSGRGIVKVTTAGELDTIADGTLFVKYVPKRREFRLHCKRRGAQTAVFLVQEKKKSTNTPEVDYHIRSHDNGFVFVRDLAAPVPPQVSTEAVKAFNASELDFGAVDVIFNELSSQAYVLEINSAPGLEGSTIENYSQAIQSLVE